MLSQKILCHLDINSAHKRCRSGELPALSFMVRISSVPAIRSMVLLSTEKQCMPRQKIFLVSWIKERESSSIRKVCIKEKVLTLVMTVRRSVSLYSNTDPRFHTALVRVPPLWLSFCTLLGNGMFGLGLWCTALVLCNEKVKIRCESTNYFHLYSVLKQYLIQDLLVILGLVCLHVMILTSSYA